MNKTEKKKKKKKEKGKKSRGRLILLPGWNPGKNDETQKKQPTSRLGARRCRNLRSQQEETLREKKKN